jgi:carbon storage regulator
MLVLTRKAGESIVIGNDVRVTVLEMQGRQIRLGIEAPADVSVHRGEVYERIREENELAAEGDHGGLKALSRTWKKVSPGK